MTAGIFVSFSLPPHESRVFFPTKLGIQVFEVPKGRKNTDKKGIKRWKPPVGRFPSWCVGRGDNDSQNREAGEAARTYEVYLFLLLAPMKGSRSISGSGGRQFVRRGKQHGIPRSSIEQGSIGGVALLVPVSSWSPAAQERCSGTASSVAWIPASVPQHFTRAGSPSASLETRSPVDHGDLLFVCFSDGPPEGTAPCWSGRRSPPRSDPLPAAVRAFSLSGHRRGGVATEGFLYGTRLVWLWLQSSPIETEIRRALLFPPALKHLCDQTLSECSPFLRPRYLTPPGRGRSPFVARDCPPAVFSCTAVSDPVEAAEG